MRTVSSSFISKVPFILFSGLALATVTASARAQDEAANPQTEGAPQTGVSLAKTVAAIDSLLVRNTYKRTGDAKTNGNKVEIEGWRAAIDGEDLIFVHYERTGSFKKMGTKFDVSNRLSTYKLALKDLPKAEVTSRQTEWNNQNCRVVGLYTGAALIVDRVTDWKNEPPDETDRHEVTPINTITLTVPEAPWLNQLVPLLKALVSPGATVGTAELEDLPWPYPADKDLDTEMQFIDGRDLGDAIDALNELLEKNTYNEQATGGGQAGKSLTKTGQFISLERGGDVILVDYETKGVWAPNGQQVMETNQVHEQRVAADLFPRAFVRTSTTNHNGRRSILITFYFDDEVVQRTSTYTVVPGGPNMNSKEQKNMGTIGITLPDAAWSQEFVTLLKQVCPKVEQ